MLELASGIRISVPKGLSVFQYIYHTFSVWTRIFHFPQWSVELEYLNMSELSTFSISVRHSPYTYPGNTAWCWLSKRSISFKNRHSRSSCEPRQECSPVWVSETSTSTCCDIKLKKKKKIRKLNLVPLSASLHQNLTSIHCNKTNHNGIILYVCDSQI